MPVSKRSAGRLLPAGLLAMLAPFAPSGPVPGESSAEALQEILDLQRLSFERIQSYSVEVSVEESLAFPEDVEVRGAPPGVPRLPRDAAPEAFEALPRRLRSRIEMTRDGSRFRWSNVSFLPDGSRDRQDVAYDGVTYCNILSGEQYMGTGQSLSSAAMRAPFDPALDMFQWVEPAPGEQFVTFTHLRAAGTWEVARFTPLAMRELSGDGAVEVAFETTFSRARESVILVQFAPQLSYYPVRILEVQGEPWRRQREILPYAETVLRDWQRIETAAGDAVMPTLIERSSRLADEPGFRAQVTRFRISGPPEFALNRRFADEVFRLPPPPPGFLVVNSDTGALITAGEGAERWSERRGMRQEASRQAATGGGAGHGQSPPVDRRPLLLGLLASCALVLIPLTVKVIRN